MAGSFLSCSSAQWDESDDNDLVVHGAQIVEENPALPAQNKPVVPKEKVTPSVADTSSVAPKESPQTALVPSSYKMPGISVSRVPLPEKLVALTFDDGPHPSLTPQLLDILKKHEVAVTFFVLGKNVRAYPQVVARAYQEGHEIASHSYSHPILSKSGAAKVKSELDSTAAAIESACGVRPRVMRPPYGAMTQAQRQKVNQEYGYHIIFWDVDPLDWRRPGSGVVAQRLIQGAKPGSILLAHDIHAGTVEAMDQAIAGLKARGYRFVTVSRLIEEGKKLAKAGVADSSLATY